MTPPPKRDQLFISYSHRDGEWVERLRTMLRPLENLHGLERWDDSRIQPGSLWREEIEKALASARVALLLVSSDFLASDFVTRSELPTLFRAAKQEGMRILWVPLRPCLWKDFPEIAQYQAAIPAGRTLASMTEVEQEEAFVQIAEEIKKVFREEAERQAREEAEHQRLEAQGAALEQRAEEEWASRLARFKQMSALQQKLHQMAELMESQRGGVHPIAGAGTPRPLQVEGYLEELTEGVALNMVKIPSGSFLMGSPDDEPERTDAEGPLHEVSLGAFFLAQTPITQAQWRAVAGWQKVEGDLDPDPLRDLDPDPEGDLDPDPSKFKGANRPVEQVSWHDATEFCRRLSQRTGKPYGLPSEAQWEYACRAGSITPFHFGATLTPELANFNASRDQTTDVASFPANGWGLHDLHGNVWEWCEDHWHASYDFATGDDQPWLIPAAGPNERRLLRGGAWDSLPGRCRSASRGRVGPGSDGVRISMLSYIGNSTGSRNSNIGFRVCCLPQGRSS